MSIKTGGDGLRKCLRIALLASIGFSFFIFHGLSNHLTPWSQALVNAIVKYSYPTQGQEEITVVLFREENLTDLQTHYPVPYPLHADIIEALSTYRPKSVFIDFAFIDNRDPAAIRNLSNALCTLRDAGSHVYLAAPLSQNKQPDIAPELLACAQPVMPEMDGKTGESGILTYFHGQDTSAGFIPTAAFALAEGEAKLPAAQQEKLEIIWGKGIAPLNLRWMNCEEERGWALFKSLLHENPSGSKLNCPYHRTISINHLLNSVGDADINNALTGKTIFYGAGFRFTGDRIESPVYGEMPGIYLHAMAYDNLLTFGEHYKRADRHGPLVRVIDFALLLAASALLVLIPAPHKHPAQSLIEMIRNARWILFCTLITVATLGAALHWGGLDIACLTAAGLYLIYRCLIQRDLAFTLLVTLTASSSVLCYMLLDLGPRNILAFIAFFETVSHFQAQLTQKAEIYRTFRESYLTREILSEDGSAPPHPIWDWLLTRFFWIFEANAEISHNKEQHK